MLEMAQSNINFKIHQKEKIVIYQRMTIALAAEFVLVKDKCYKILAYLQSMEGMLF